MILPKKSRLIELEKFRSKKTIFGIFMRKFEDDQFLYTFLIILK